MSWQEPIALAIVAVTALIFLWRRLRRRRDFRKATGCGCGSSGGSAQPRVIYRARKGERREIIVKSE